jgi:hypothetical protein
MAVLRGSLAADPAARPQSAAALRDTLLGLGAPRCGAPAPATAAAAPRAQSGPNRTITQDAWVVGSLPGSSPTKNLPPGAVARRRGPGRRLAAAAAGLAVIIAAAAASLAVLRHHDPAPGASMVLYSFKDGTTDGWRAGANVAVAAPVTSFLDGYGYPGVATGFTATVTLTSGSHQMTKTVPVRANTWNRVEVSVSSWSYRDHVTGIAVSFAGTGSTIGWNPNFQIDDVGYTT